jgi:hypothetical protein
VRHDQRSRQAEPTLRSFRYALRASGSSVVTTSAPGGTAPGDDSALGVHGVLVAVETACWAGITDSTSTLRLTDATLTATSIASFPALGAGTEGVNVLPPVQAAYACNASDVGRYAYCPAASCRNVSVAVLSRPRAWLFDAIARQSHKARCRRDLRPEQPSEPSVDGMRCVTSRVWSERARWRDCAPHTRTPSTAPASRST